MQVFGPKELIEDVFNKDRCIGCGACVSLCPYLKSYKGKTGMLFSCNRPQGRCHAYCPKTELDLDELSHFFFGKPYDGSPLGSYLQVLVSKAGPGMSSGGYQSGGTVSALMTHALQKEQIDAAILTDQKGLIPTPQLVTSAQDVVKFASSKYMTAPTVSMVHEAQKQGCQRVGIVGTPCQLTAVAKFRTNPLEKEDFVDPIALTIGLFCTWALDARSLLKFLSEKVDVEKIRKMDIPPPPADVLVVTLDDREFEIPLSEIRPLIPNSCGICPDMTAEWTDISVGVSEGMPGWNSLIIRTQKGADLVMSAEKDGLLVTGPMPEDSFEHLCTAAGNKKARAFRRALEDGCLNNSADGRAALRVNDSVLKSMNI